MSVYGDSLAAFGNAQTVEIPPDLIASPYGGIKNTNDATAKNPLGTLYRYKGNVYRYVKFDNGGHNVAALSGGVTFWKALDPSAGTFTVTSDETDTLANINGVSGIILNAVTDAYFTWIQVGGVALAKSHASQVAGDIAIGATTDLVFGRIAADGTLTSVPYGVAIEALSTTEAGKAYTILAQCLKSF
jgi:hypothetical protein